MIELTVGICLVYVLFIIVLIVAVKNHFGHEKKHYSLCNKIHEKEMEICTYRKMLWNMELAMKFQATMRN